MSSAVESHRSVSPWAESPRAAQARRVWQVGWSVPGLFGFGIAMFAFSHRTAAELMITTWLITFVVGLGLGAVVSAGVKALTAIATVAAFVSVSGAGIAVLSVRVVVPLVLSAGLTHPTTLRHLTAWLRRRFNRGRPGPAGLRTVDSPPRWLVAGPTARGHGRSPHSLLDVGASPPVVGSLSNAELCLTWRRSYLALERLQEHHRDLHPGIGGVRHTRSCTAAIAQQVRVIAERQGYLDELERRDQEGFLRWLRSGARPASDPSRYVRSTDLPSTDLPSPDLPSPDTT